MRWAALWMAMISPAAACLDIADTTSPKNPGDAGASDASGAAGTGGSATSGGSAGSGGSTASGGVSGSGATSSGATGGSAAAGGDASCASPGMACATSGECCSGLCGPGAGSDPKDCNVGAKCAECSANAQCPSGRCDGCVCLSKLNVGSSCDEDGDCNSGVCGPGLATDLKDCDVPAKCSECTADLQCPSGRCEACACTPRASLGAACDENSDCQSASCGGNGKCQ